jgi:hypothetical protein
MQRKIGWKVLASLALAGVLMLGGLPGESHAAPVITAKLTANPASYSGKCPATIKFDGEITVRGITRGPLTVKYEFIRSDGAMDSSPRFLTFQKDGSLPVSSSWTLGGDKVPTYSGWKAVKVTAPAPVESNKANFSVKCAAEEKKPAAADSLPLTAAKFVEKPLRKIPANLSAAQREQARNIQAAPGQVADMLQHVIKVDLTCQIKAYYDEAHTKPLPSGGPITGLYHLSAAQHPLHIPPFTLFFGITVKNEGVLTAAPNITNRALFSSLPPFFAPQQFVTAPETLSPGEAAEYVYHWGPFYPSSELYNKTIQLQVTADFPPRIAEDDEANNNCFYHVRFVYP